MRRIKTTIKRVMAGRKVAQKQGVILVGLVLSVALLGYMVWGHDEEALLRVAGRVRWAWVTVAGACALASYVMIGVALRKLLRLMGHFLSFAEIMGIALVSTTANYFVSAAGFSGFALKAHLLRKRHVPYGITVTVSVLSSAVLYIVLAAIIGQGLIHLLFHLGGARIPFMEGAVGLLLLSLVAVPLLVVFFNHEIRGRLALKLFHWLNRVVYFFSKAEIPREDFDEFESQLKRGLETVRQGPGSLTAVVAYTGLDWFFCMATLYFSFLAVGIRLPVGHLSAGFTIGQTATLIPVLPGGLGAVEGAMAAIFETLGLDWEKSFAAILIYRFLYYAVPSVASIFVLWGLKMSEPSLVEAAVQENLPQELRFKARELERKIKHSD